ncbi:MAG: hypothetical protein ACE5HJ_00185 [Thermoplasmata archaeon]
MVGTIWLMDIVVGSISVALLLGLTFVYGRNFRKARSPFALGLLIFALLFLVENLVGIFSYFQLSEQGFGPEVALPMLYLSIAEASAFAVLLVISWG